MTRHTHVRRNNRSHFLHSRRGASLPEMMIAVLILSLLLASMMAGLRAMAIGAGRQVTDSGLGMDARKGVDEMLSQMRYAKAVADTYTVGGKTYTTNSSTIVLNSYGYDPATPGVVLPTVIDYMIFEYDPATKEIRETLLPGVGSKRISRSRFLIAKNVEQVAFTYRIRDQYVQPIIDPIRVLRAPAASAPTVTVKGAPFSGVWSSIAPQQVVVKTDSGNDVQILYAVNPAQFIGSVPIREAVQQVDVAVSFSTTDSRNIVRKLAMSGSACLRNNRVPN